jgi:hypothetical protein
VRVIEFDRREGVEVATGLSGRKSGEGRGQERMLRVIWATASTVLVAICRGKSAEYQNNM